MRRIYESNALRREDGPFTPGEQEESSRPKRNGDSDASRFSRLFVPDRLAELSISVSVSTDRETYPVGVPIPFTVTMKNAMPFSVSIPTASPVLWNWSVDGVTEASRVALRDPPEEPDVFGFARGERKQFQKRWPQAFRVSDREWEYVSPGTYTIGAEVNVADPVGSGLYDETTIEIVDR